MLENTIYLTAPDTKKIQIIQSLSKEKAGKKAIVLCHGLPGSPTEHIHQCARDVFCEAGYDVYRIAFYANQPNCRNIINTTLAIHASDLNALLAFLKPDYSKIFVAGHSYGGITMLYAQPEVTALSFWDSTFMPSWIHDACAIPELNCYSVGWGGVTKLLGKPMYDEAIAITETHSAAMAARITQPSQVILSAEDPKNRIGLFAALTCEKELKIIDGADHCFVVGNTAKELAKTTLNWFGKF